MTKREFERRMERARKQVIQQSERRDNRKGVCRALILSFDFCLFGPKELFQEYFTPSHRGYDYSWMHWLDDYYFWNLNDKMTQLERRLVFLESFKGFCECYELYKEWG